MSLAYFPFYTKDYVADTKHLTLAEHGAYLSLMILCWHSPGCQIPADDKWIRRKLGVSELDYDNFIKPIILEFFAVSDDKKHIINRRLLQEFRIACAKYDAQSKGGRVTQEKLKSLKNKDKGGQVTLSIADSSPSANHSHSHNHSHNHNHTTFGGKDASLPPKASGKRRSKNKGTTLPEDWKLPYDEVERLANKHRVSEETVRKVEGEFRTYWHSRAAEDEKSATKVSWDRTFENDITRKLMLGIIKHRSY